MKPSLPSPAAQSAQHRPSHELLALLLVLIAGSAYRAWAIHTAGLNLYVDEAQYWTWAKALDWGYYSKPPVIAAIIAGTTALFGDGELAIKSGALLLYPTTTLMLYALAARLYDRRVALWTAIVFFTLPGVALSSAIISTDVPLFLCWTVASYALVRALDDDRWRWWLLLGAACGLGLLTKYTMGIFALATVLYCALTPAQRRQFGSPKPYGAALVAALIFAPNLWWNAQHGWPTFHHTADISNLETGPHLHWDELWAFIGGQAAIMGPILFLALLWRTAQLRQWLRDDRERLLACCALPFLAVIALQALLGRANANWGAMTYATGTLWMVAVLLPRHRGWLVASLLLHLALAGLTYHYHALVRAGGATLDAQAKPLACLKGLAARDVDTRCPDFFKRVQGWDSLGTAIRAQLDAAPGTLLLTHERDTMSELLYYARPASRGAVLWNPTHAITSHYALVTQMEGQGGRSFLFLSRDKTLPPAMADSFLRVTPLPDLTITATPGWPLAYHLWRLEGFIGYPMALR